MKKFPFKLVTFDVNGTLLKPKRTIGEVYSEFAKRQSINADPGLLNAEFRKTYKLMDRSHPNFGLDSKLGWKNWWTKVVVDSLRSTLNGTNVNLDSSKLETVANDLIEYFAKGEAWKFEKHSEIVVKRLRSNNVELGIISNTDPRIHSILRDKFLSNSFAFIVSSYEAKAPKPQIEIFNHASDLYCKKTGKSFCQDEALHIGNSYQLDFLAAKNAGWHSVLVNSKDMFSDAQCLVFPTLKELDDYFVQLRCDSD